MLLNLFIFYAVDNILLESYLNFGIKLISHYEKQFVNILQL